MDHTPLAAEEMAELHPMLFRTSHAKPSTSFSEQHAFAVSFHATRPPNSPAVCCLLAAQMATQSGNAS